MESNSSLWDSVNSNLQPSEVVRTRMPENPSDPISSSEHSVLTSDDSVIGIPLGILVARQEFDGRSQVGSPAMRESSRTCGLVMQQTLSGDIMFSSSKALMPGRPDGSSDALVPSAMRSIPSLLAHSIMELKISFLQ